MHNILYAFKDFDETGGAEKNLIEIAEHFSKENNVFFVVASINNPQKLAGLGKLLILPSRGKSALFFLDAVYILYISFLHNIDLIHSHHRYPTFIASLVRPFTSFKLLTTVHNVFPDKEGFSKWGDHAIAVSKSVYEWVVSNDKYPKQRASIIYNGILTPPDFIFQVP